MDRFQDGNHVWLRSRVHGTYLHADKDGHGVSLSSHRMSMKTAWVVHLYYLDAQQVLLHSAAYGRYLSATNASAPFGCRGFRVAQRNYDELDQEAIRWDPVNIGPQSEGVILLRQAVPVDGLRAYLRANGRSLPWKDNRVSVDFYNISTMMEWEVVTIPSRERIPRLPRPPRLHFPGLLPTRLVIANGEGCNPTDVSFSFPGRSVFRLRDELIGRLRIARDVSDNLVMYVRAGIYGRLTPLVVNLPRSSRTLVITVETPANSEVVGPRYPDFDAE